MSLSLNEQLIFIDYISAMFESSMLESTLDRIELQDVSGTWLPRLVRFALYSVVVTLTFNTVENCYFPLS